jgi:hypothetical protein
MTNHHCVRGNIAAVQGEENWIADSFVAKTLADEVRLPGLTVQQLISMREVTKEMNEGVGDGDDGPTLKQKHEANLEKLKEAAKAEHPELSPEVITMHNGATYQLYLYRVYDDIRLVCSPHLQTSHFGGDPDNFTFPRFGIDFTFCRAYIDNKPADTSAHYFRWSTNGPKKNELAFVTGNPGSTGRLKTKGQMAYSRQAEYPIFLDRIDDELPIVKARAHADASYEKRMKPQILQMENRQKAIRGFLDGLHNPEIKRAKDEAEAQFRARIQSDGKLNDKYGTAWEELERVNEEKITLAPKSSFYAASGYSPAMVRAVALVSATDERLTDKQRTAARGNAKEPIQPPTAIRTKLFVAHLERTLEWLGKDDPLVSLLIGDSTPADAAARIEQSAVSEDAVVDKLLEGGRPALESSDDNLIRAALLIDRVSTEVKGRMRELNAIETRQATRIGQALYAAYGNNVSPDATFSLRFSDGVVRGYRYNGTLAPYRTTFYGLYARNAEFDNKYPFNLPQIWLDRKDRIDMTKGVNFVATNDIIGGNSGSPIVNKDQEVIGLIFDGNIEMLGNRFLYKDDVPRSVSVHSDAILEACEKIYDAQRIVEEIRQ